MTGFTIDSEISVDSVRSLDPCPPATSHICGSLPHPSPPYSHNSPVTTNDDPNSASPVSLICQRSSRQASPSNTPSFQISSISVPLTTPGERGQPVYSTPEAQLIPFCVSNCSHVADNRTRSHPVKLDTYISVKRQYDTCIHKSYVLTSENDPFCTSLTSAAPSREVQIYKCFTIPPTVKPYPWTTTIGSGLRYELMLLKNFA